MSSLHDEVVEEVKKGGKNLESEKLESSEKGVDCRVEDGLSRKITRTED